MRRDIFMVKEIQHTATGKMSFRMTSFEEILSYFNLRNVWLISKLCAKRQLLHFDENEYVFKICDRAMKLDLYPYISPLGGHFYYRSSPEL